MKVYPYKMGSQSARDLSRALGALRVREDSRTFRPRNHVIVNWGNPRLPDWFGHVGQNKWLNRPLDVQTCSNKLLFFRTLHEAGLSDLIPEFSTDREQAEAWEYPFIARTHLNGSAGLGAYYFESYADFVGRFDHPAQRAQLFTKYVKKQDEYRVHFGPLGIFHVQQKRKRHEEEADFKIRNHANGWVFTIQDVHPPVCVTSACERAIAALPLDFGALDVVYNAHYDRAYVLEVNTACGLEGTTLNKYVDMIREVTA